MAQLSYSYKTPEGIAGSILDIATYSIDSRINGEDAVDAMLFGMGGMQGNKPGIDVLVPAAGMTIDKFEGVIMTGFTQQMNMGGQVNVYPKQTVGLMRYGKCWVRVDPAITPAYGEQAYLIISGPEAGMFTNVPTGNLAVKVRFVGGLGTGAIAPVEVFNQLSE